MIGLASAGKTTFLAALYHVVESESVAGSLQLARIPPLREHLERIRQDWLACKPQTRTTADVVDQNVLEMKSADGSTPFFFPDLAGERLAALVEDRICGRDLGDLLGKMNNVLLFIHPDTIDGSPTINEARDLINALEPAEPAADVDQAEQPPDTPTEWDVEEMVSTQVKLVDLLQITNELSDGLTKIGVVVSAWDRVKSEELSPEAWVRLRMPLLSQYLRTRPFPIRFFGVSAAGGDLKTEHDRLCNIAMPADRIEVVGIDPDQDRRDITVPVRWLVA
jgi:hypothetical protein